MASLNISRFGLEPKRVAMLRGEGSSAADLYEFAARGPWRIALRFDNLPLLYVFESTGTDGMALHFQRTEIGEKTTASQFLPYGLERIYLPEGIIQQLHQKVQAQLRPGQETF